MVKPISEISGVTTLGAQLMGAADPAQARQTIGTDSPTDTRPPSTHDHDTRYYTETEIDTQMAGKSNTGHNHDTAYYTKAQVDAAVAAQGRRKVTALMSQLASCYGQAVITSDDQIQVWGISANSTLSQAEAATGIPMGMKCNGARTGTWVKVTATRYNVAAVTSTGELWVAGDNTVGQLGQGDTTNTAIRYRTLQKVTIASKTISNVWLGGGDSTNASVYVLTADGLLYSWGYNFYGQLGVNNTTNYSSPQAMAIPAGSVSPQELSVSQVDRAHVLIRTSDGKLHVCGNNNLGQLGLGDTVQRNI
ncbi:MAG: RCC1 domain-containing protein, partial [Candidatus Methylumidiphilus sp.]